jgi:hypothetical protein
MTEVCPVDLGLFAWQSAQTQKGFGLWTWSQACDEMPEVMGTAAVTALVHHYVQPGPAWASTRFTVPRFMLSCRAMVVGGHLK